VQIVYLDQNKWIDLSRAVKYPADNPELRTVLEVLVEEANAGRIVLPLTQTNIYETHKINDPERRHDLAYVQATLSQGRVFRGRHKRLDTEVTDVLRGAYGLEPIEHAPGAVRDVVGIRSGAFSGNMKVSFQAARSIG